MKIFLALFCSLSTFMLCSCSAEKRLLMPDDTSDVQITNSIIYIIHGDASYLYHDLSGAEIHADERMVSQARFVAENSPNSEVFIFHIKPGRNFLFLFPLKDRELFHYKKGRLVNNISYYTDETSPAFDTEAQFYKRYSINAHPAYGSDSIRSIFLFYGHQIPEFGAVSYNASYPRMAFNIDAFSDGLAGFKRYKDYQFDIVVLSSCNNATPGIISKIAPMSQFVIASPGDLHLSHINSLSLLALDSKGNSENRQIALYLAESAFDTLKILTQTEITISVFESKKIIPFLNENLNSYKAALNQLNKGKLSTLKCIDCKSSGYMDMTGADSGVITYYHKSAFGRPAEIQTISGWGCWKPPGD